MSNKIILFGLFLLLSIGTTAQEKSNSEKKTKPEFYKRGSLLLPNTNGLKGYIWVVSELNGDLALFFKKNDDDLPIKYKADEIISFQLANKSQYFQSIEIQKENESRRIIAELLFDGDFKLFSVNSDKNNAYYLADNSGKTVRLVNTYDLPSQANNYQIIYNYEYKDQLAEVFNDKPQMLSNINSLTFTKKNLTNFLIDYHKYNNLQYNVYSRVSLDMFAGASAGWLSIENASRIYSDSTLYSPFARFSIFGGISTSSGRFSLKTGMSYYYGISHQDVQMDYFENITCYMEDITKMSLASFDLNIQSEIARIGKLSPFISAGAHYYIFTKYSCVLTEEDYYRDLNIVYTFSDEDNQKPDPFLGITIEAGLNYQFGIPMAISFSGLYNYFPGENNVLKKGVGFSISYNYKF